MTLGHLDIIKRASLMFDELIVAVLDNTQKTPLFSTDERVKILCEATKDMPNVKKVPAVKLYDQSAVEASGLAYDPDYYYFSVVLKGIPTDFYGIRICVKTYIDNNGTRNNKNICSKSI